MLELTGVRNNILNISRKLDEVNKLGRHEKSMILEAFLAVEKTNSIISTLERKIG